MRPSMDANLMTSHVLLLQHRRVRDSTGADHEHSRLQVVLVEVLQEVGRVQRGTVVVGQTPCVLVGAGRDIRVADAATACPPAAALVGGELGVGGASTGLGGLEVGNLDARVLHLLDPLLDLGRVRRGRLVERRVVGGREQGPCTRTQRQFHARAG